MNVMLGNEKAVEGYKKPIDPEDYGHQDLVDKAQKIGVSTKLEPMKADSKNCPDDLLAARISDFVYQRRVPGKRVTAVSAPMDERIDVMFRNIVAPGGIWDNHAEKDSRPTWVESDNEALAMMLADHFAAVDKDGKRTPIPIGRPKNWKESFTD